MRRVSGSADFLDRFWSRVVVRGECWLWRDSDGVNGRRNRYGQMQVRRGASAQLVHLLAWMLEHAEPFPKGKIGCHSCDNTRCVNAAHIWPGTYRENSLDAFRKGRLTRMPNHNARKTHCKHGHEFTPENTIPTKGYQRQCRTCNKRNSACRRERVKAEKAARLECAA